LLSYDVQPVLLPDTGEQKTDTRQKIRDAALNLFIENGYGNTTIADIERAAGLAPRTGGFYRHFPGKADLAAEIGETSIIENRRELGFDGVLPLGDTRAELVLIARGDLRAAERQAPLAGLIAEIRHLDKIQALEARVNQDLLDAFTRWLAAKPFAENKSKARLAALVLTIFGGWIFYLSKRGTAPSQFELTDEVMLAEWADMWADRLDRA
jgi:AcrR family transcriptional regulator